MSFLSIIIISMSLLACNAPSRTKDSISQNFQWSITGSLPNNSNGSPSLGLAGSVIGISHDRLLIGGGSNFPNGAPWDGGKKVYYDEVYVFKKEGDSIINIKEGLHLPNALAYSANCTTSKGIIAAGGENKNGAVNKVLLISWNKTAQNIDIQYLPNLPQPLTNGMITVNKNVLYFAGGENAKEVSDQFYALDLNDTSKGWKILPALEKPITDAVLYTQFDGKDTCIYLAGGRKRNKDSTSDLYKEVYQFNLKTKQWSQKASLPYALSAQTGIAWGDSSLLVFSGDEGKTFHQTEVLLMQIAREKDPYKKQQLMARKDILQKSHPGYNGNVLSYNTYTDKWKKIDSIPFPGQVTTTALKWDNEIVIPCGEIRAGVRTPEIILGKD